MSKRHPGASLEVVRVVLEKGLRPIELPEGARRVLLVVLAYGEVAGEVAVEADNGTVSVEAQRDAIDAELGERLWRRALAHAFTRATRASGTERSGPQPSVSVVVSEGTRPERLEDCLTSLGELRTRPLEVIVVERATANDVTSEVCERHGARHFREEGAGLARARNRGVVASRGELVAFIEADCVADPGWLDRLSDVFADRLAMAVVGYVGPLESTRFERTVVDGVATTDVRLPDGNCVVRRGAFAEVGAYDADLFRRILKAGHRIAFDPGRIVWREHPAAAPGFAAPGTSASPEEPDATAEPARVTAADHPPLTVTIASYNRRERLRKALEALADQTYPGARYEVVVVVDGSTDGSVDMARSLDMPYSLRVLEQENRGLSACRNRGGEEAENPIVVWLDDDIFADPPFVAAHADAHRGAGPDDIVLGHYPPAGGADDLLSKAVRRTWHDFFRRRTEPGHQWSYVDFADGNISTRPDVMRAAGGWDEDFAQSTVRRQDSEFAIRLLQNGARFVDCPAASGQHHFDFSLAAAMRNRRVEGNSDVVLGRKHPQVRDHLYLARIARTAAAGRPTGRAVELVYRRPRVASALIRASLPLLRPLEALDRRHAWAQLFGRIQSLAYVSGVRDGLPTLAEFDDFVAPVRERRSLARREVRLDRTGTFAEPPLVSGLTLDLRYGDTDLAEVDALEPETQWDWEALTDRVVHEACAPFRAAVEAAGGDPYPPSG